MKQVRFYTKEEDAVILQCVSENSGNLTRAFKKASELIDRTPAAIQFRWRGHLKKREVAFLTVGVNAKNFNNDSAVTSTNPHVRALIAECERKIEVLKNTIEKLKSLEL